MNSASNSFQITREYVKTMFVFFPELNDSIKAFSYRSQLRRLVSLAQRDFVLHAREFARVKKKMSYKKPHVLFIRLLWSTFILLWDARNSCGVDFARLTLPVIRF